MIIPTYKQANCRLTFPEQIIGKWYGAYQEEYNDVRIVRFLHPDGWRKDCYWWDSYEEMEKAFNNFGQVPLPITESEYEREVVERRAYEEFFYEEAMRDLEERMEEEATELQ